MRFSLVYPTRHRPAFIEKALWFLARQEDADFEVVVSDNYVDAAQSCKAICDAARVPRLTYVHPPSPLGMVENWNYALRFAKGDYVCYFTDKMFLRPGTLAKASACIDALRPDIVNWVDDSYQSRAFPDYFGAGSYTAASSAVPASSSFAPFDPRRELDIKGRADAARHEQPRSTYVRGKVCFGAYSAALCRAIVARTGALFHNVSPDYTSMILALSLARSAAEISAPGIIHVQTDLSNGGQVAVRDELALGFLKELGNADELLRGFLVPGLYSSSHNVVSGDYLSLKAKHGLDFAFDAAHWLVHATEDLDAPGRIWSSREIEAGQRRLLAAAIAALSAGDRKRYERMLQQRAKARGRAARPARGRRLLRALLPDAAVRVARHFLPRPPLHTYARIEDVLSVGSS